MTDQLDIRSGATEDIEEAYGWYEDHQEGLGDEFLRSVREGLNRIQSHPLSYATLRRGARHTMLDRFPYGLYYRVEGDTVVVFACYHSSRDPKGWQNRM